MSAKREAVPRDLRRRVLVEAGHRCAIPTCRSTPVEIAHIEPWRKVKRHEFENLIALCPTCHARFDSPRSAIDRKAMRQYKSNLSPLSNGYMTEHVDHVKLIAGYQVFWAHLKVAIRVTSAFEVDILNAPQEVNPYDGPLGYQSVASREDFFVASIDFEMVAPKVVSVLSEGIFEKFDRWYDEVWSEDFPFPGSNRTDMVEELREDLLALTDSVHIAVNRGDVE
ncbi:HNH endonuclease [Streptomyces rubiginosohelvolus]|uniref:HNH endonuclease n=1 Tax=Streptomyces rubiginosohelvolus TaxID=67362 RepID=UPI0036C8A211